MISIVGGFAMILGSFFIYKGDIYKSVIIYFFADLIWMILSFQSGNIFGGFVVLVALIVGIIVFYKMNKGIFRKDIL
jgi:hypothetical protein